MPSCSVHVTREGTIGLLTVRPNGPSSGLDEALVTDLAAAFVQLQHDAIVETICLTGGGDAFLSGVDVRFFVRSLIGEGRCANPFLHAHRGGAFRQFSHSRKPVIAWVNGPAWGAGLELALACQAIVADTGAKFCFPETGLGIYPGLGGTQRTPRASASVWRSG